MATTAEQEAKIHRCDQRRPDIRFHYRVAGASATSKVAESVAALSPASTSASSSQQTTPEKKDGARSNNAQETAGEVEVEAFLRQEGAGSTRFVGDTSSVLWPVARYLCNYFCEGFLSGTPGATNQALPKSCLELGSGTGLVGIICGHIGVENVVLTDQTLALCEENIELQPEHVRQRLSSKKLLWGDFSSLTDEERTNGYDMVVASDVICHQDKTVMEALVSTIAALLSPKGTGYVAYEFRDDWWTCSTFCDLCEKKYGLKIESHSLDPEDEDSDYILYKLTRKSKQ
ncbi:unnamed protein product [Amoebophrya sp. A25]|nr:unnamed protein product [Amoebophrya sp. A25]|eukprot:GSA25T00013985001.1